MAPGTPRRPNKPVSERQYAMGKSIPLDLINPAFEIAIDAAPIAAALGLEQDVFLRLLEQRKIDRLCERGTGEDAGLYRATFYHGARRARVVVDRRGHFAGPVEQRIR